MAEQIEDGLYDDQEAIKYIQNHLPQEAKDKFSDDDILYISDTVYDYFVSNGMLEDEEVDIDMEDLVAYVIKQSKRDGFNFDPEAVYWAVEAELDYEESLG